jgi:AcrR family transcriptional regulator
VRKELAMGAKQRTNRKDLIVEQARILFWQKGYDRTSVRAIARACGFEPGNIYNYFPSKEAVLYEVLREEVERLHDSVKHLASNTDSNPVEQLRTLIHNSLNVLIGTRLGPRLPFDMEIRHLLPKHRARVIELRDQYDQVVRSILRSGQRTGDFAEIDVAFTGFCLASTILRTRVWYTPEGRLSVFEIGEATLELFVRGISAKNRDKC